MSTSFQRSRSLVSSPREEQFKASMHDLSSAVVHIVQLLSQPTPSVTPLSLGARLAHLLTSLRVHRAHAVALGELVVDPAALDQYLDGLRRLRGSVAHWLTIHAAQPKLIYVELADFEAQCWSTLGMGVVLLDGTDSEDFLDSTLSSRFHQWWEKSNTRPAGFLP